MMARLIKIMLTMLTIMLFTSVVSFAGSEDIVIQLDGMEIVNDSPPVIVEKRTLVPARAVFEAMGGEVSWDDVQRTVTVELEDTTVVLVIDSKIAYINGEEQQMDVPAMILSNADNKNGRTMIPVRFVAEAIGCDVDWNEADRIVSIVTPEGGAITDFIKISQIELSADGSEATIYADNEIIDFDSFVMESPNRLVIDIDNAVLDMDGGTIWPDSNDFIRSVRSSQYSEDTVRIVADLKKAASGTVEESDSEEELSLNFETTQSGDGAELVEVSPEAQAILDQYNLSALSRDASEKWVVIDPGHGGEDPGSMGYSGGQLVLNEKDVNLDIALRLQNMLEAAGVSVYMIRTTDETIPLYDRQDTANSMGASLYVAIHNNCYSTETPSGTEVLYYSDDAPMIDGISGAGLANKLQRTLVSNLGLVDRGAKAEPELAVLRRTSMPAVIIEGAFLSNPSDLAYLQTNEFREKYAMSAAQCIIGELNDSVE